MNSTQCKMARASLGLNVADLAAASGVAPNTIMRFEAENVPTREGTVAKLRAALEARGITFLDADSNGPGIRIRGVP